MYLIVEFDLNSDLVSVPKRVAENIDVVRHSFLRWVYSPQNKKKFVKKVEGSDGQSFECICYNFYFQKLVQKHGYQINDEK